jgi:threonine/homoserine/homoserine lactone efflux protein
MHRTKNGQQPVARLDEKAGPTVLSGALITLSNPMTIVGWLAVGGNFFLLWASKGEVFKALGPAIIVFIMIGALIWFVPLLMVIAKIRHMLNRKVIDILIVGGNVILFCFGVLSFYNAFLIMKPWMG